LTSEISTSILLITASWSPHDSTVGFVYPMTREFVSRHSKLLKTQSWPISIGETLEMSTAASNWTKFVTAYSYTSFVLLIVAISFNYLKLFKGPWLDVLFIYDAIDYCKVLFGLLFQHLLKLVRSPSRIMFWSFSNYVT
jgi:hypothetical protein